MFGPRFRIFRLAGFDVHIDLSWFLIAALVSWSLAEGLFNSPELYDALGMPGAYDSMRSAATRWTMGIAGAAGLFASIVLHELGHATVARRFGIRMKGITLFIFGGVAEMIDEPPSAKAEFWVAIAGPIVSVLLGIVGIGLAWSGLPAALAVVLLYLGAINFMLVAFNLIPAFPLDGGRVLRSIIWAISRNLRTATRITSSLGAAFGIALIAWGVLRALVFGNVIGGIWFVIIGLFLRQAARMSYQQLLLRRALEGEPVERFMRHKPITVPPTTTLSDLVNRYIYVHHYKMFPVTENGHLLGCITTRQIKDVPQEQWPVRTVGEVADGCSNDNTVSLHTDAMEALAKMHRTGASRLLVVDQGNLVGVLTLKDLVQFMSLKVELEDQP